MKFSEIRSNEKFGTIGGTFVKLTDNSYAGICFDGSFIYSEASYDPDTLIIPFGESSLMERDLVLHSIATQKFLSESE